MKMPWGKYKGCEIEDVPSSYLKWLAENAPEYIAVHADEEWCFRDRHNEHIADIEWE